LQFAWLITTIPRNFFSFFAGAAVVIVTPR
jgi:hypothetical protein